MCKLNARYTLAATLLAILSLACNGSADSVVAPPPNSLQNSVVRLTSAHTPSVLATGTPFFNMSGTVGGSSPVDGSNALAITNSYALGSEATMVDVDSSYRWAASAPIYPGVNQIEIQLADTGIVASVSDEVTVVYNESFEWDADISLSETVHFEGDSNIIATVQTTDSRVHPTAVYGILADALDGTGLTPVRHQFIMSDGGVLPDQVANDGIYTGSFDPRMHAVNGESVSVYSFTDLNLDPSERVYSTFASLSLRRTLTESEYNAALAIEDAISLRLEPVQHPLDYLAEAASIRQDYLDEPLIVAIHDSPFEPGFTVEFIGGLRTYFVHRPPETLGAAPASAATEPISTTTLKQDCPQISSGGDVLTLSYFPEQFSNSPSPDVPGLDVGRHVAVLADSNQCLVSEHYDYHGAGQGELPFELIGGQRLVCIQTHGHTVPFGGEFLTALEVDMAPGFLFYLSHKKDRADGLIVKTKPGRFQGGVAITSKFISKYADPIPNSVVVISACYSSALSDMSNAFYSKGAGFYCGWTDLVGVDTSYHALTPWLDAVLLSEDCLWSSFPENIQDVVFGGFLFSPRQAEIFDGHFDTCSSSHPWSFFTSSCLSSDCSEVPDNSVEPGVEGSVSATVDVNGQGDPGDDIIRYIGSIRVDICDSPSGPICWDTGPPELSTVQAKFELVHDQSGASVILYDGLTVMCGQGTRFAFSGEFDWLEPDGFIAPQHRIIDGVVHGSYRTQGDISALYGLSMNGSFSLNITFDYIDGHMIFGPFGNFEQALGGICFSLSGSSRRPSTDF